jgi:hypothetical protein
VWWIFIHRFGAHVCCGPGSTAEAPDEPLRKAARYAWAVLLARIYAALPLLCPMRGGEMRMIAFITEGPVIREMLDQPGEPSSPPRLAPARGPPLWDLSGGESGDNRPADATRTGF